MRVSWRNRVGACRNWGWASLLWSCECHRCLLRLFTLSFLGSSLLDFVWRGSAGMWFFYLSFFLRWTWTILPCVPFSLDPVSESWTVYPCYWESKYCWSWPVSVGSRQSAKTWQWACLWFLPKKRHCNIRQFSFPYHDCPWVPAGWSWRRTVYLRCTHKKDVPKSCANVFR